MPQLTLYTAKVCPFAQRAEIALAEVGADFKRYEIDLSNKPEWYAPQVNPASKVPALAYGGPDVPPDEPSPESIKIPESLVLLQLIPELFPESSTLIPKDPIVLAKARLFIESFSNTFIPAYIALLFRGEEGAEDKLRAALDTVIQARKLEGKKYAVSDEFTIADAAVVPFIARAELLLAEDLTKAEAPRTSKFIAEVKADAKYKPFWDYFDLLKDRESFKATWWPDAITSAARSRLAAQ
ncbi:hypothetical protein CYLTODRAFT_442221 [Cylindrobasidium torrendii FP15055 ss-10]|uniref:Glutathione S-transferase n=1 Tax=Cylindrobasidium torrendii FP15055 ss-10 TaxID=1314674 RepID=A0A0D7BHZ1_9AGAR|nr:hypothetical protein CYLTODRAFT_442221 [Cylindrobasidium torrendii FP15055 ss-10]